MNVTELPVNIQVMDTRSANMLRLRPITVLDTFEGGRQGNNFHPEGLFSNEIFGRVGSQQRDDTFARIDLKLTIMHPFIFRELVKLRGLYKDIIQGKGYAVWNKKTKDFDLSTVIEGSTGYYFFTSHLHELDLKRTGSDKRDKIIDMINSAIKDNTALTKTIPVAPAGFRDVYVEPDGRVNEDEINTKYRSLIASANAVPDTGDFDDPIYDTTRNSMQNALNGIFEYLWNIYEGKRGFMLKRYYSSGVENGTRNVLTANDAPIVELGKEKGAGINNTTLGLFQTMKALLPVTQYLFRTGWINEVFSAGDSRAYLTNPKTLNMEMTPVSRKVFDNFNTPDGINKLVNRFFDRSLRHKPVMVEGKYVGLVYKGKIGDKLTFKFFNDIKDLPKGYSRDDVSPITWVELFYVAGYRHWNTYPMMFTRYPVAGLGSTVPGLIYCKTTTTGDWRFELDDDWQIKEFPDDGLMKSALEYPIREISDFMETASISVSRIAGLAADFDGDK